MVQVLVWLLREYCKHLLLKVTLLLKDNDNNNFTRPVYEIIGKILGLLRLKVQSLLLCVSLLGKRIVNLYFNY